MKSLKMLSCAFVLLSGLVMANTASAGIPVIDSASIASQLVSWAQQAAQMGQEYQQLQQQYQQMQQQYASLNGVRGMASLVNNPALRNYLPSNYQSILSGGYGNSAAIRSQNKRVDLADTWIDPDSTAGQEFEANANQAAINRAVAEDGYVKASERFADIQVLLDKVNAAPDAKDIADLQARIQVEQVMQQNEATKLAMLAQLAQAQRDLQNQRYVESSMNSMHN